MALTSNTPRDIELGDTLEHQVAAGARIFEGSCVGINAGYARPLVAGDKFGGFSRYGTDNTGGAAGAKMDRALKCGQIQIAVVGASAVTDYLAMVYASDDGTFTLTQGSNSPIGRVTRWVAGTICVVEFDVMASEGALA